MTESTEHWDGTASMPFTFDDGGRAIAGFKGFAGDCVTRAVAIVAQLPYSEVYAALAAGQGAQRMSKGASARNGISTTRKWFKQYMQKLGFRWVPCMGIGTGCKIHLLKGELPMGRLAVRVSRHYVAVIDGVIHDTHDPQRATIYHEGGRKWMTHRCVYGYWKLA